MKLIFMMLVILSLLFPGCSNEKDIKIKELTKKVEQLTREREQDTFRKKWNVRNMKKVF